MERKFYSLNLKIRAFTLLECLVALLAISGSVLVISGLTRLMTGQFQLAQNDSQKDWQIFCEQMRAELAETHFDKVDQNFLYVTKEKTVRFGQMGFDFRKTDSGGRGYQPMLYHVKAAEITEQAGLVVIQISFEEGGERTFFYKF